MTGPEMIGKLGPAQSKERSVSPDIQFSFARAREAKPISLLLLAVLVLSFVAGMDFAYCISPSL
jgi:hypothetical protein